MEKEKFCYLKSTHKRVLHKITKRLIAPQLCMNEWCNKLCSSAYHSHAEELF